MTTAYYIIIAAVVVLLFLGLYSKLRKKPSPPEPTGISRAGDRGEQIASEKIAGILHEDDRVLTNVRLEFDNKNTELDQVIVNQNGVFIIEVKNYKGGLKGKADDYTWKKYHVTETGKYYEKDVRNPIKQVKREIYIIAGYLKANKVNLHIKGYAYLIGANSPVQSSYILNNPKEIEATIHRQKDTVLDQKTINKIIRLLQKEDKRHR